MFSFFAHPIYFYGLILVIMAVSLFAVFSMGEEDKKTRKKREEEALEGRMRLGELEKILQDREAEYKGTVAGLEKSWEVKSSEYSNRIASLESRLAEQAKSNSRLEGLKAELANREEELKKAVQAGEESRKELALANQMYNGLKGQYDELEEKFSQLFEEFLKEQKKNQPAERMKTYQEAPQPSPAAPAAGSVQLPKIPNLRSTVQEEKEEKNIPPSENKAG